MAGYSGKFSALYALEEPEEESPEGQDTPGEQSEQQPQSRKDQQLARLTDHATKQKEEGNQAPWSYLIYAQGKTPFPEGQAQHQELHRIIDEDLDYDRDFDNGQVIANPDGANLVERIERGNLPQWFEQTLRDRLTANVVARFDRHETRKPLLDLVLDWASKWAAVRVRYTTACIGGWPKRHLQSFNSTRFARQEAMMVKLNRSIIHASDPEGDAWLTMINLWHPTPATNMAIMSTSYEQQGTEDREDANYRYYLVYKLSPREVLWIAQVRDTTEEPEMREFFAWIVKYIKACADYQEKFFDAIDMRSRGLNSAGMIDYRIRLEGSGKLTTLADAQNAMIRALRSMLGRAGVITHQTATTLPGLQPGPAQPAFQPTVADLLIHRQEMDEFRRAVGDHNRAARDFSVTGDLELEVQFHGAVYNDVESMFRKFPGSDLGTTGLPNALPDRLLTNIQRNLPYSFNEHADIRELGLTATTVLEVGFNWTGSGGGGGGGGGGGPGPGPPGPPGGGGGGTGGNNANNNGGNYGGNYGGNNMGNNRGGGANGRQGMTLNWRERGNNLRNQTAEFLDAQPWVGCPVDTKEKFLLLCDKFEELYPEEEQGDGPSQQQWPTGMTLPGPSLLSSDTGSMPPTPSKGFPRGLGKLGQKMQVMKGAIKRPIKKQFSQFKSAFGSSPSSTPSKLGGQAMTTPQSQSQPQPQPPSSSSPSSSGQSKNPFSFSSPGGEQTDLSTPPSTGPSKPSTSKPPPPTFGQTLATATGLSTQQDKGKGKATLNTTSSTADPFIDTTTSTPVSLGQLTWQIGEMGKTQPGAPETDLEQHRRLTQMQATLEVIALELGEQARRCLARMDYDGLNPGAQDPFRWPEPGVQSKMTGSGSIGLFDADDDVTEALDGLFGEDILDDDIEGGDEEMKDEEVMDDASDDSEYDSEDDIVMTGVMQYDSDDEDEY